jgi:hypothetical protein
MISALDLVDPQIAEDQKHRSVTAGLHDVHRYASAYWLPHLEQIAADTGAPETAHDLKLPHLLKQLYMRHNALRPLPFQLEPDSEANITQPNRLMAFKNTSYVEQLAQLVGKDRNKAKAQSDFGTQGEILEHERFYTFIAVLT